MYCQMEALVHATELARTCQVEVDYCIYFMIRHSSSTYKIVIYCGVQKNKLIYGGCGWLDVITFRGSASSTRLSVGHSIAQPCKSAVVADQRPGELL